MFAAEESHTAFINDLALKFIHMPGSSPWFLHISYLAPHPPYLAPEPYHRIYHPEYSAVITAISYGTIICLANAPISTNPFVFP